MSRCLVLSIGCLLVASSADAQDALAGCGIDATQLGLLAVSQGSWVAGLAARLDSSVRFVVNVSGPVVPVVEADTYAVEAELRRNGWAQRDSEERLRLWQLNAEVARDADSDEAWERLQAGIEAVRQRP